MSLRKIKLKIIPKPKEGTRTVLVPARGRVLPVIKGAGKTDYVCGNCDAVLMEGMSERQVRDIVICCSICGLYNDII